MLGAPDLPSSVPLVSAAVEDIMDQGCASDLASDSGGELCLDVLYLTATVATMDAICACFCKCLL